MSSDDPAVLGGLTSEQLRAEVRAVLRDVLPATLTERSDGHRPVPAAEPVTIRTDADLDALVRRVATICEDPRRREAMRDGRHGFRLVAGSEQPPAEVSPVVRVDRGAVTERTVRRAAADKARLVLGPRAVLTPLARDTARSLGVDLERER